MSIKNFTHDEMTFYQSGLRVEEEIRDNKGGWLYWLSATWNGPYGSVRACSFLQENNFQATTLWMDVDGVSHTRRWPTCFGKKTVARLAREFQEELFIRFMVKEHKLHDLDLVAIKTMNTSWGQWDYLKQCGFVTDTGLTSRGLLVSKYL